MKLIPNQYDALLQSNAKISIYHDFMSVIHSSCVDFKLPNIRCKVTHGNIFIVNHLYNLETLAISNMFGRLLHTCALQEMVRRSCMQARPRMLKTPVLNLQDHIRDNQGGFVDLVACMQQELLSGTSLIYIDATPRQLPDRPIRSLPSNFMLGMVGN